MQGQEGKGTPGGVALKNLDLPRGRRWEPGSRLLGAGEVEKAKQPRSKRGDQLSLPFPTRL